MREPETLALLPGRSARPHTGGPETLPLPPWKALTPHTAAKGPFSHLQLCRSRGLKSLLPSSLGKCSFFSHSKSPLQKYIHPANTDGS